MKLPTSYNDLTVKQYQEIDTITKSEQQTLDKNIALIACLTGKSVEWIEAHTPKEITGWANQLTFLNKPQDLNTKPVTVVRINSRIYRPILDIDKITAAQLVTLKYFQRRDVVVNLHQMLACVFTNLFGTYKADNHKRTAEDMLEARMGDVYGTLFFYSVVLEKSSPIIQTYLKQANEVIAEVMPEVMVWAKEQGLTTS